jgi:TorA maturation chaperone TorD
MMVSQKDASTRANCFKLLAACFYEPEKDLFVEENLCQNLQGLLDGWASGAAKAALNMGLALLSSEQQQLSIAHAELFIGPFELIAPPYGSVYLEKNRQIMGDTTIGVLRSYQDAGLAVDEKEPPDHIAIELEFMSFLNTREAEARAEGNATEADTFFEKQKEFYHNYLRWVPNFCEAIKKGTKSSFYQSLADCLDRLMVTCRKCYGTQENSWS